MPRSVRGAPPTVDGDWVARQIDRRDVGRDARLELRMRLFDRQGRVRERGLVLLRLSGETRAGAGPGAPKGDRILLRFTSPAEIAGTSLLVWQHPGAEDERFLYLPALGRVRRIAGAEAQDSFVGTDFTYEDIGGRELDEFTYRLLNEHAAWTAPDGTRHPAYRLESRRKDPRGRYPRIVSLVRQDSFVVVEAEIFNRRDELEKHFEVRRLDVIDGIWTPLELAMTNRLETTRTELVVLKVDYNLGLTEADFSRRALERGAR